MTSRQGLWFAGLLLVAAWAHAAQDAALPPPLPAADKARLSYAIGYQIGSRFTERRPEVELPVLLRAIQDAYAGRQPAVPMLDMQRELDRLSQRMHAEARAEYTRIAEANAKKSADYLARHAREPGVEVLPSGIEYAVLKAGTGSESPTATSRVTVNYRGMLADGTEFDSTWAHGAPVSFNVDKVIPGWRDVIPRMHVGDRWRVVIPPHLAYGRDGALPRIGPNEVLVFEIELLAIQPPSAHD